MTAHSISRQAKDPFGARVKPEARESGTNGEHGQCFLSRFSFCPVSEFRSFFVSRSTGLCVNVRKCTTSMKGVVARLPVCRKRRKYPDKLKWALFLATTYCNFSDVLY